MKKSIEELIENFLSIQGEDRLVEVLERELENKLRSDTLTIIADDTMHHIPVELVTGEKFVFSSGNFELEKAAIEAHLAQAIRRLVTVLQSRSWARVRLIFSGHCILAATIKLAVYRITHRETEDVLYFGQRGYITTEIHFRELVSTK